MAEKNGGSSYYCVEGLFAIAGIAFAFVAGVYMIVTSL
ncbi:hypothetical protein BH11PAT4_BH11PAT4_4550 [soil metagenome]